jgi:hypothetical protein
MPYIEIKDEDVWGTYDTLELAEAQVIQDNGQADLYPSAGDYELAITSQSACNLTAIVKTFAQVTEEIWAETRRKGKGSNYANAHPICRLYAEQIMHLSNLGTGSSSHDAWMKARDFCGRMVEENDNNL